MTIGELAARCGLASSAIRFYEKAGLLTAPTRRNGRRVYSAEAVYPLALIGFAKENGFTLPEIRLLLRGFPESTPAGDRWRKLATAKIVQLEESIAKAQAMRSMLRRVMHCRCMKLEQCARAFAARFDANAGSRSPRKSKSCC